MVQVGGNHLRRLGQDIACRVKDDLRVAPRSARKSTGGGGGKDAGMHAGSNRGRRREEGMCGRKTAPPRTGQAANQRVK